MVVLGVVLLGGGIILGMSIASPAQLGGMIHNVQESFDEGIAVDGYERISGTGVMVEGGADATLTSGTDVTITAAQICDSTVLTFLATGAASTTTLPTVATLVVDCLRVDGDAKTILFRNTGATATATAPIAAGAGMVLLEPDGQDVVIAGGNSALIHLFRTSVTEIVVSVDELIDA